jgi:hypothetical protein
LLPKSKGKPDTYVRIFVPSLVQSTIVKKTRVIKKTCDPEYHDSDTVWMDSVDILNIEVWEKRVIGSEVCIGRLALTKSALPVGTPSASGCWSAPVTLALGSPKDRKTKNLLEAPVKASSGPLTKELKSDLTLSVPGNLDSLETSSESAHRGTITLRINYESRHEEWMALAPLRGKFFVWGAVRSQNPDELILTPQIVQDVSGALEGLKFRQISMTNGYFCALSEDGTPVGFGIDYAKISEGENACYTAPARVGSVLAELGEQAVYTTCGVGHFLIVTAQGHLYAMGLNSRGELGLGHVSDSADFEPRKVVGLAREKVVGACAGVFKSLCWTSDGKLFSWGDASLVRMWTPETDWIDGPFDHMAHTDEDEAERDNRDIAPTPKRVQGLDGVKIVKATTTCTISAAISDKRDLYTWGDHHCAGFDTHNLNIQYPQRIEMLAGMVADVAVGPSFVVALDTEGKLWSWGCIFQKNADPTSAFPLGRGGERSFQPMLIPGLPPMTQVTCTGTTVFAIDTDGQLWCWGDSQHGECFQPGVTFGRPVACEYFRDLKIEMIARGYGSSCCVYTSPL